MVELREAVILSRMFFQTGIFHGYHKERSSEAAMGGGRGAQRPVLRLNERKKTGAYSARAPCTAETHKFSYRSYLFPPLITTTDMYIVQYTLCHICSALATPTHYALPTHY
jgi:hypothetical protein